MSAAARADLADIDGYGAARFGEDAADAYSRGFREAFALLRTHPRSAPVMDDYGEGVRCLIHRSHRILYAFDEEEVLIARVLHHARDVRQALDDR